MFFLLHDVTQALKKLKKGKRDGVTELSSDNIINGGHRLNIFMSLLLNSILKHCYSPQGLNTSVIISIPKNKRKSLNDSGNYRGIALCSVIGKLLEMLILSQNKDVLKTCKYQFGFKPNHSTSMCTFVVNEVVKYYNNNKTDVYMMMFDASKAFDRINYVKLFQTLLDIGLCPVICCLLAYMYTNQCIRVKWEDCLSSPVKVSNGVKQGGILSPILFTVYMDKLLQKLSKSKLGCHINRNYMGSFGYADDIVLLAPKLYSLKQMMTLCDDVGKEYHVTFNPDKYQFIHIPSDNDSKIEGISHNGCYIKTVNKATHLGHDISVYILFIWGFTSLSTLYRSYHDG